MKILGYNTLQISISSQYKAQSMSHIVKNKEGKAGYITLDRPDALNSLTYQIILDFDAALRSHEADDEVEVIVVRSSSERAFCAGGDMKSTRLLALDEKWEELQRFFQQEYALNLDIARCGKPYVSLVNGIAMGGGLGLSVHGDVMVVSETTRLAMPETAIGFFPDVGGTYFLNNLSYDAGRWLAICGQPVTGFEAVTVGLATHYVHSSHWRALTDAIEQQGSAALDSSLSEMAELSDDTEFEKKLELRRQWFGATTNDALVANLESASNCSTETHASIDASGLLERVLSMSPYAMNLTRQLLKEAQGLELSACLQLELRAGKQAVRHPDFVEGIRAVLVDKEPAKWLR